MMQQRKYFLSFLFLQVFASFIFVVWQHTTQVAQAASSSASLNVPLTIHETSGVTRHHSPITTGIPLPQTLNITNTSGLAVLDDHNQFVPAQFTVTARWAGAPTDTTKPIKWVLVDFETNTLVLNSTVVYHLTTGANPKPTISIHVTKGQKNFTVNTGKAKFVLSKTNFNLFQQVYLNNQAILQASPAASNTNVLGTHFKVQSMQVEQTGPVHTVILVKGWLNNAQNQDVLAFTARLHFYAGQSYVKVEYGVWNDQVILNVNGQPDIKAFGSPHTELFSGLDLNTTLAKTDNLTYTLGSDLAHDQQAWRGALTNQASIFQASSGGPQWQHSPENTQNPFRGFQAIANGQTLHAACGANVQQKNCRSTGWVDLTGVQAGIAVGSQNFWQNYPKALTLKNSGEVQVGLFPEQYGMDFELRVGEQKTHQLEYYFHPVSTSSKTILTRMIDLQNPLQALAPASWYLQQAKVFDASVPYNKTTFPDYEGYNDAAILYKQANFLSMHNGSVPASWYNGQRAEQWGWRNAGDSIAEDETSPLDWPVYRNQQYDDTWYYLYQFIRTLNVDQAHRTKWGQLASLAALNQADEDIVHSRCTGKSYSEMTKQCMDPSLPYATGWAMGGRLTNQDHADPSPDLHRHALIDSWAGGLNGMLNYWYLTGDGAVKDAWKEYAKNTLWRVENTPCNQDTSKDCGPGYAASRLGQEDVREGAYNLEILTDAFAATGDQQYLVAAQSILNSMNPKNSWVGNASFHLQADAKPSEKNIWVGGLGLQMRSVGHYLDIYKTWFGKVDLEAQDNLLRSAQVMLNLWQSNSAKPTQYHVYDNGAYTAIEADPLDTAMADGLIWALDYNDGRLNQARVQQVAQAAFNQGSVPFGKGYARNTFMTMKTQVMMGISGWRYMQYAQQHHLTQ